MEEQLNPHYKSSPMIVEVEDLDAKIAIEAHDAEENQSTNINTTALTGMRGILSLQIVVFHALLFCKWRYNILGSTSMTFFFLISGFLLGLRDGKQKYFPTPCCGELSKSWDKSRFDGKHFYQRRMARTLPLYYLTNLMCIPLIRSGHSWVDPGGSEYVVYVLTFFASTTWFGIPLCLNGPSWFVSTMWFFYWIFPSLLPQLQQYDVKEKRRWIFIHFLIQLFGGCALVFIFTSIIPVPQWAFFIGTFWPPSRLPVFIMGVLAGLLRNDNHSISKTWNWKRYTDLLTIMFLLSFIIIGILENHFIHELGSAVWMQLGIAYVALEWIVSLSFDDGTSITAKIFTSKMALFLGEISYPLYLFHEPFIQYLCWINYGDISKPQCEFKAELECEELDIDCGYDTVDRCKVEWEEWQDKRLIPMWNVPIVVVVSLLAAVMLNRFIEEPLRKKLRPSSADPAEVAIAMTNLEEEQQMEMLQNRAQTL